VASRVGQTIVQITYRPGSLLGIEQEGRDQSRELAVGRCVSLQKNVRNRDSPIVGRSMKAL